MKDWKHFLLNEANEYLYWNGTAVATSLDPVEIPEGPEGWDGISILWERDMQKFGVVRSFTVPLSFINDGAKIITDTFYRYNIETKLLLKIQKRQTTYNGTYIHHDYPDFYTGEIDLTSFKDDGVKVTVTVLEGGIVKKIKAAESTVQELSMDSNYIKVLLDGFDVNYSAQMTAVQDTYQSGGLFAEQKDSFLSYVNTSSEQKRVYVGLADIFNTVMARPFNYSTASDWFLIASDTVTINFHFRLKGAVVKPVSGNTGTARVKLVKHDGTIISTLLDQTVGSGSTSASFNVDTTLVINLVADDKLFLMCEVKSNASAFITWLSIEDSTTDITYKAKFKQTIVRAKLPSQVFKELITAATGDVTNADDTFIQAKDAYALSPGDSVRGLTGVKMKTHLNDFNAFAKVLMKGGFGVINGKAVIKDYGDFLSTASPIPLQIKNLVISDATDQRINTIKIGYPDQNIDDINGKYEFNNTHIYDTPVKSVVRELNLVCPYLAQPFLIELTRINLDGKTTTDNTSDNSIFILHIDIDNPVAIDGETVYPLMRQTFDTIEGIPDGPNMFNLLISPKRLLKLHASWINSLMHGFAGQNLVFKSTEKNHDLKTTVGSVIVDEDANEVIGTTKIFLPFYLDADTNVPVDLVQDMAPDPNVCFSFGLGGEGFPMKAGIQPETKQEQSYKLLCSPNVDIKNLQANAYK